MADSFLDRYRIVRRLGSGGMATVYLCEDERLGRRVAVKRLHADSPAEMARRLEREARVAASLNHSNLVPVYDVAPDEEGVLMVMEYVEGETLAAALRRGPLAVEDGLEVIRCVAAALDHAHQAGVVHRDVKPANVLLADDRTKLVDLGIAQAAELTKMTATGTALGTPVYMAPEQLEGRPVGPGADVYALAAVAYETLSGRRARSGTNAIEVAHRVTTEPAPDLRSAWPEAPPAAAEALRRGLDRDPQRRQRSAGDLAHELSDAIEGDPTAATVPVAATAATRPQQAPTPAPPPSPRHAASARPAPAPASKRRLPAWVGIAAALGLAAVAIALVVGGGGGGSGSGGGGDGGGGRAAQEGGSGDSGASGSGSAAADQPSVAPPSTSGEAAGDDPAQGAALNDQGKSLIDSGRPEEAVPVLERSVASFPEGTTDVNYAYALFNLGNALRLSGRPEEAIPVLEQRLEIPNQRPAVARELELARQDTGQSSSSAETDD